MQLLVEATTNSYETCDVSIVQFIFPVSDYTALASWNSMVKIGSHSIWPVKSLLPLKFSFGGPGPA